MNDIEKELQDIEEKLRKIRQKLRDMAEMKGVQLQSAEDETELYEEYENEFRAFL